MLNQDRIVYRPTRQEVGYYEYHRWAEDPRSAITSAIIDRLRASGAFKSVALYDGRTRADFVLRGRIEQLEEVDYDAGVKAAASISAELLDASNQRVVWESSASAMRDVTTSEVSAVVEQLTAAVDEAVTKLSGEIAEHVQSAEPVSE